MKRGSWAARVAIFSGGILGVAAFFLVVVRSLDITVAGVEAEALVLPGVMTAPFTLGVSCCWCWERPPLSGWFVGPGPRNSDGNPDSSQAVVLNVDYRCNSEFGKRIPYIIVSYKTVISLI